MTSLDPRISLYPPTGWPWLSWGGSRSGLLGCYSQRHRERPGRKNCHSILPSCFDFWKGRLKRTKNLSCFLNTSRVKWKDPMAINVFGVFGNYFCFNFWDFQVCSLILYHRLTHPWPPSTRPWPPFLKFSFRFWMGFSL